MENTYDPASSYQYGSRAGSPRGSVGSMGMQPNAPGSIAGHAQIDSTSDASFNSRQQASSFQQPAMSRPIYGEEDDGSMYSRTSQAPQANQGYLGYSNESLPGRRASGAPLLDNYSGPLDNNYSGPIPYSNQYHSGPLQAQQQQPVQYSGPVPTNYSQPFMDPSMGQYGPTAQVAGGEHARLAVIHGMILNDLNSVRRKVVDYMETARSRSQAGSDVQDPLERARVQDALAQLEQQQMMLGNMLQQNGIDTQNLPLDQSMLGSRAGSIAGDIPDVNSMMSYGQREAAIQNAIQRLQQQQQNMMQMMGQEGIQPDMSQIGYDQNAYGAIREQPDVEEEEEEEEPDPYDAKPYQRKTQVNWIGLILFIMFLGAFSFYMYIRIRYTLDIGIWLFYGVIVLMGECIGAFAVFLYAMCIVVKPLDENARRDPTKAPPKCKYRYHVRVVVPCYSESLAILQRTVMAAYNATLPAGCTRTVYLCDDGKDQKKREWVESLDSDDVVYVSGRKRKGKEMNGKSCNINNCLKQIYPKNPKQGMISMREVICVFDADQVASQEFFVKTVHLLDGGSDIAMVLSPQCFYNINPGADIFNNSNIHFWEYMQPGYDAMGFISCTGTNFLCRARALQECGWFPEDTITEDFGLGIQLTKLGWKCRYVQEYLAIGEAPEEVRNTFQQRSRWCKGHFQILFSAKCPLFDRGMNMFHRVMSCGSVFSYMVNCFTTPMLFIVPIVSVWFGVFPIALNRWFALGITVYGVTLFLVQNYHHTFRHLKVLWFANLGNTLLWTVYFKAMFNTSVARCWKGTITFKTTSKGAGGGGPSALRDIWVHIVMFLTSTITVIVGAVGLSGDVNLPLVISLIFALYNCVPYYLVIHYAYFGRKKSLKLMCMLGMFLQNALQLAAIILVWVLLPKDYNYERALQLSVEFFETQRSGPLLSEELSPASRHLEWREASAESDSAIGLSNDDDLIGGWYVTGLDGHTKYTVAIAYTVGMLCWGYSEFAAAFADAQNRAYTLNNIKWATDYLIKTHLWNEGSQTTSGMVWYVGNVTLEREDWARPENITAPREGIVITNGVQVFTAVSAAFSSCHRALADVRQDYADELLRRSISLYSFSSAKMEDEEEGEGFRGLIELSSTDVVRDENAGFISETLYDDMLYAAAWLHAVADDFEDEVNKWYKEAQTDRMPDRYLFNWDDLFMGANMVLLQRENGDSDVYRDTIEKFLKQWVCGEPEDIDYTTRGRAQNENDPALSSTVNIAFFAVMYAKLVEGKDWQKYVGYRCWAMSQARYILGDNSALGKGFSYLIGYGANYPTQVYDRGSSCPPMPEDCTLTQKTSNEPNPNVLVGALIHGPQELLDEMTDVRDEDNIDTMVRLDWNAAVPGMFAGLADLGGSWAECLQGYGTEYQYHPICNPI